MLQNEQLFLLGDGQNKAMVVLSSGLRVKQSGFESQLLTLKKNPLNLPVLQFPDLSNGDKNAYSLSLL